MSGRAVLRIAALALRLGVAVGVSGGLVACVPIDLSEWLGPTKKKTKKKKKSSSDETDDDDDEVGADRVDLGKASFPPGTDKPAARHDWEASRLTPADYRLTYAMSTDAQKKVLDAHAEFARRTGYTPLGGGKFKWMIPPGCEPDMGCAFGAMSDASNEALKPLTELFKARQREARLSSVDVASLVVTFVQNIHYERPKDQPFEILPPASVVAEERGDCDSKSLLAHLILREFDIDSVMLSSRAHAHAMLGIAIPAPGTKFVFRGRSYAFTELTAKDSPIGHINPELLRPDDWRVVPTRWPESWWSQ
jgi:hypothetical protein